CAGSARRSATTLSRRCAPSTTNCPRRSISTRATSAKSFHRRCWRRKRRRQTRRPSNSGTEMVSRDAESSERSALGNTRAAQAQLRTASAARFSLARPDRVCYLHSHRSGQVAKEHRMRIALCFVLVAAGLAGAQGNVNTGFLNRLYKGPEGEG